MANLAEQKTQMRDQWTASAPGWDKYFSWLDRQFNAVSNRLLDAAAVGAGTRVLDLACGSGEPAMSAAKRGAKVTATDFSPQMVEATRRRAAALGLELDARVMDIEQLDVPDGAFDAVTCRFGLMFCPDLSRAAAELHRAVKPGGRFAVSVWDQPAHNPFFTSMGQLVQQFTQAPPPDPTAPGVFRLCAPGELDRVLRAGGFTEITVEPMPLTLSWASPEDYWTMQAELAAPLKAAVAQLPAPEAAALRAAVIDLAKANIVDGEVRFAAQPLVAFGTR